jgi:cytochrome c556
MHGKMEKDPGGSPRVRYRSEERLKVAEFERMDKEFHANLESLARAAQKSDGQKMTVLTKKLLDGCTSCHSRFRP